MDDMTESARRSGKAGQSVESREHMEGVFARASHCAVSNKKTDLNGARIVQVIDPRLSPVAGPAHMNVRNGIRPQQGRPALRITADGKQRGDVN
jgi:hypothetical protein